MIPVTYLSMILGCNLGRAAAWLEPLKAAMALHDISTPARMGAFLAQLAHESNHLGSLSENLNYTPQALMATFNTSRITRFTPELAQRYGRTAKQAANQEMIANIAYASRMGNGDAASRDGWRYRGRGPIQLTGKDNYRACGQAINLDLLQHPDLLIEPDVGAMAAAWFWTQGAGKNLNLLADAGDITGISKAINGGSNGLADRIAKTNHAMEVLA